MTANATTATPSTADDVSGSNAHDSVSSGEIAIGVIIGRTSEFFDFFVYAIASVVVFPKLVFPYVDPLTGTLYSFGIFALAFIARPIGTTIFLAVDRNYGRGAKLTIALFMLGTSTVAVAFLPGYDSIGVFSAILLSLLRIGQGLALTVPGRSRGWYAMIPQLGAPLGLLVASALFAFFITTLSAGDFLDWGWRYPCFVAFAINVVALFSRLRIVVTPEYSELFGLRDLEPEPVAATLQAEGRNVVVGTFAPLASFALFHMVTVFPLSWVFLFTEDGPGRFLIIEMIASVFGVFAIIASGPIADRVGRRTLLGASAVAIAAFSGFAPQLLDKGGFGEALFMLLGFVLLGISFGQSSGSVASNFSRAPRYPASALTADFAWLFGAGFAPLVALFLASNFGLMSVGAYLLSAAICTLLALALSRRLDR